MMDMANFESSLKAATPGSGLNKERNEGKVLIFDSDAKGSV